MQILNPYKLVKTMINENKKNKQFSELIVPSAHNKMTVIDTKYDKLTICSLMFLNNNFIKYGSQTIINNIMKHFNIKGVQSLAYGVECYLDENNECMGYDRYNNSPIVSPSRIAILKNKLYSHSSLLPPQTIIDNSPRISDIAKQVCVIVVFSEKDTKIIKCCSIQQRSNAIYKDNALAKAHSPDHEGISLIVHNLATHFKNHIQGAFHIPLGTSWLFRCTYSTEITWEGLTENTIYTSDGYLINFPEHLSACKAINPSNYKKIEDVYIRMLLKTGYDNIIDFYIRSFEIDDIFGLINNYVRVVDKVEIISNGWTKLKLRRFDNISMLTSNRGDNKNG